MILQFTMYLKEQLFSHYNLTFNFNQNLSWRLEYFVLIVIAPTIQWKKQRMPVEMTRNAISSMTCFVIT